MISQAELNKYYSNRSIRFEIVKCIKNKELTMFGDKRVRCMVANQLKFLDINLDKFMFYKSINNLYYSLANFDWNKMKDVLGYRCFSFAHTERKDQMVEFNERAVEFIKSYDLGIDFDNHDGDKYSLVYSDCTKLKDYFDKYEVGYSLKTSGSGFHIEIEHDNLPKHIKGTTDIREKVKRIGELMVDIKLLLELDTLDVGEVKGVEVGSFYDTRRVFKVPYTIDYKTGLVALPLDDIKFAIMTTKSDFEKYTHPNFVLGMNLFNRGPLKRKGSSEGFDKFLEEVIY